MKFALRIISFGIVALALVYVPAAKAESFQACPTTTLNSCEFTLTSSNGPDTGITLYLTGNALTTNKHVLTGDYGITGANGWVTLLDLRYAVTGIYTDPQPGTASTSPGGKAFNNKLFGLSGAQPWVGTDGLLLEIPSLLNGASDLWILRHVGNKYELVTDLAGSSKNYILGTVGPPNTMNVTNGAPEPVTLVLFGSGLVGIGGLMRRRLIG